VLIGKGAAGIYILIIMVRLTLHLRKLCICSSCGRCCVLLQRCGRVGHKMAGILDMQAVALATYIIWRFWEGITAQGSHPAYTKAKNFFTFRCGLSTGC